MNQTEIDSEAKTRERMLSTSIGKLRGGGGSGPAKSIPGTSSTAQRATDFSVIFLEANGVEGTRGAYPLLSQLGRGGTSEEEQGGKGSKGPVKLVGENHCGGCAPIRQSVARAKALWFCPVVPR